MWDELIKSLPNGQWVLEKAATAPKPTDTKALHEHLSHGHEDPQHAIHSAVNALGRKMGVNSVSMDTPEDQARQSGLKEHDDDGDDIDDDIQNRVWQRMVAHHPEAWNNELEKLKSGEHNSLNNPYFKSALEKIGGIDTLTKLANASTGTGSSVDLNSNASHVDYNNNDRRPWNELKGDEKTLTGKIQKLSDPESHALEELLHNHNEKVYDRANENLGNQAGNKGHEKAELPVHQQLTYNKRPKKLGATIKDKKEILGDDPEDEAKQIQYMKLHKKLTALRSLLKAKRND
jgi:hypothetical protein